LQISDLADMFNTYLIIGCFLLVIGYSFRSPLHALHSDYTTMETSAPHFLFSILIFYF